MLEDDVKKGVYVKVPFSTMFISDVNVILPRGQDVARIVQKIFCRSTEFS